MIDVTPDNLRIEIEAAMKFRQKFTRPSKARKQRYAGDRYREDWRADGGSKWNHEYEYVTNMLPAMVHNNPKVSVKSRRPRVQRELVEAMQHGLNRWVEDVQLAAKIRPTIQDMCFDFGVMVTSMESVPGYDHQDVPPMRPSLKRISPTRFFMDPQGDNPYAYRFAGHWVLRDREDLLMARTYDGRRKYNREAVLTLTDDQTGAGSDSQDRWVEALDIRIDRGQVAVFEVYVPERNKIYTLGMTSGPNKTTRSEWLRPPRDYHGHPRGPYVIFGIHYPPDQIYPLAPLAATEDSVTELNAHANQASRQADKARKLILVDGTNRALTDAIKNYEDGTVAAIPNFTTSAFAEVSIGGPDPKTLQYMEYLSGQIDRRSGLTDIQRGQISGKATATEVKEAAAAVGGRLGDIQNEVKQCVIRILENAAYLMFYSESVVFPIVEEKAERLLISGVLGGQKVEREEGGQREGTFYGGVQAGQEEWTFFDLELKIEPYTMEHTDEGVLQRRIQSAMALLIQSAPMILQFPFINWPDLLDDYFAALGIQDGRKYINFETLAQVMQARFQAGEVGAVPGIDGAPPLDLQSFRGPPGMPAGSEARAQVKDMAGTGEPPAGDPIAEMAAEMAQAV